ncbi:hypothetical protein HYU50_04505 [Candidatus Woesearchaeota archaeon]|nr:hypothetical protein [Candidatus Woesearchaeota archaeon]
MLLHFLWKDTSITDERPKAASKVNVFGKVKDDYTIFKKINGGDKIIVEKLIGRDYSGGI